MEGDTLKPEDSLARQTVFVENNYNAYYGGGYANPRYYYSEWEYPYFYLGLSTGYSDYYGPYWYDYPGYYGGHRNRYYGGHPTYYYPTTPGGGGSSSYQSDKRLFNAPLSIPRPEKGERAGGSAGYSAPAPKPSVGSRDSYAPAPAPSANTNNGGDSHPPVRKGQRR